MSVGDADSNPNAVYPLGSSSGESARLQRRADELAPDSSAPLDRDGLGRGDRAIDLGGGARGVIELPCERVSPGGRVVGLDADLTSDPVRRSMPDGQPVCDMRLAVNDRQDQPTYIDVATFGARAGACTEHLSKGRAIAVSGPPHLPRIAIRARPQRGCDYDPVARKADVELLVHAYAPLSARKLEPPTFWQAREPRRYAGVISR